MYEVAKFGDDNEEILSRKPRGVSKSSRSVIWLVEYLTCIGELGGLFTSCRGSQLGVRVLIIPARGIVEGMLDVVHKLQHVY